MSPLTGFIECSTSLASLKSVNLLAYPAGWWLFGVNA